MQETTTTPTNDDIEAVIQMATQAAQNDPRSLPLRDTRTQLFVANLPYRVRWQDLKDLFRRAGTVLRADVSLGPDNRSRGYGTVLLATAEDAGRAVDMFSGYSWQGRILEVRADRVRDFDQPFPEVEEEFAQSGRNLFVGNLPFHVQWQDLKDLFRQAGTIVRADVALGPDGRSRGFGTVVFATEKDARRAVGMFSGYEYNGRTLKVHYDKFSQGTQMPFDLGLLSSTASPFDMSASTSFDLTGLTAEYANDVFAMPHPHHHLQSRLLDFHNPTPPPIQSLQLQQPPQLHQQQRSPTAQASLAQLQSQLQQLQLDAHSPSSSQTHSPPSLSSSQQQQQDTRSSSSEAQAQTAGTSPGSSYAHAAKRSPTSPNQHPHHPGPIALPPPPALAPSAPLANGYAVPSANQNSNNNNNGAPPNSMHPNGAPAGPNPFAPPAYALTPLGLPPITPSMPPFSFLPMPSPGSVHPQQGQGYFTMSGMGTPTHAHFMNMTPLATPTSPHFPAYIMNGAPPGPPNGMGGGAGMGMVVGMGMGPPSALSPGAFWGRAGEGSVYGAPVGQPPAHPHAHSPYAHLVAGGSPGFFGMHPMSVGTGAVPMEEPKGYFDFPPAFGTGPPMGGGGAAGVEKEIMKGDEERKEDAERERASGPPEEPSSPEQEPALPSVKEPAPEPEARLRRHSHSSDAPPPPSPMREGKRPPPLRLPSATGSD